MGFFKKEQAVRIEANIQWEVAYDRSAQVYMGVCKTLNLNAIGDSWAEFQDCANDALESLLQDLFRSGEFESFMRENGWKATPLPLPGSGIKPRFDVPFNLIQRDRVQEMDAAYA